MEEKEMSLFELRVGCLGKRKRWCGCIFRVVSLNAPPHPPPHPPKNVVSSFRGIEASKSKIHWGMVSSGKIIILQGVGHPISCLQGMLRKWRPHLRLI